MTPHQALRIVLDALPVADQAHIARHAAKWEVCHCGLAAMRRRKVWAQVGVYGRQWVFHVDPEIFRQLSAAARIGLMAHEVGHALCHRGCDSGYGSEDEADANVRRWGFGEELAVLYEEREATTA